MSMDNAYRRSYRRTDGRNWRLIFLIALILFAGLFLQVTMLARISAQSKRATAVEREIYEMNTNAENMELSINQYHDLEAIAERARLMGMSQPDETQIRVVSIAGASMGDTTAQNADFSAPR